MPIVAWMPGPWELGLILVIVLIFFGIGKLPQVLGQLGSGVKAFKDGMKDEDNDQLGMVDTVSEPAAARVQDAEELS
jgi:sec-independent protein translocase protein TatA